MDGKRYEQQVAIYLRSKGFRRVSITKASNDYGIDIICYKRRLKYGVQCKYYSKPVGVHAVQQVVGGMRYYDCDRAMVVTNNTYTRQAIELAERNDVDLIEKYSGKSSLRKVLLQIILVLGLLDIMFTSYWVYSLIGLIIYLVFLSFGIYVKYKYKKSISMEEESLEEDNSIEEIED